MQPHTHATYQEIWTLSKHNVSFMICLFGPNSVALYLADNRPNQMSENNNKTLSESCTGARAEPIQCRIRYTASLSNCRNKPTVSQSQQTVINWHWGTLWKIKKMAKRGKRVQTRKEGREEPLEKQKCYLWHWDHIAVTWSESMCLDSKICTQTNTQ